MNTPSILCRVTLTSILVSASVFASEIPLPNLSPTPPPAATGNQPIPALSDPVVDRLKEARAALAKAQSTINRATTPNHGGFVEKARVDVTAAIAALEIEIKDPDSVVDDKLPGSPGVSIVMKPAIVPAYSILANGSNSSPNLANTMKALAEALDKLKAAREAASASSGIPLTGDLNASRNKVVAAINQANSDVMSAYDFAQYGPNGRGTRSNRATRSGPPATSAPAIATNKETATSRLLAMKTALESVLEILQKVRLNPEGQFLDDPMADIKYALENVSKGLDFVKAHPENDVLYVRPGGAYWPDMIMKNGAGLGGDPTEAAFPTLRTGETTLVKSESAFLNGEPSSTHLIMNTLGGLRDSILRGADTADAKIVKWTMDFSRRGNPRYAGESQAPPPPSHLTKGKGGSITGVVLDPSGTPAAYAAISVHTRSEIERKGIGIPTSFDNLSFPGGEFMTVTDATGTFTIRDLPADVYIVTAELTDGARQQTMTHPPVEVKAGEETKIVEPLKMFQMNRGFGG